MVERHDHRVLAAPAEEGALEAVGEDLLRKPLVRHDREAHLHEVPGRVRERAQLLEAFAPRAAPQLVHEPRADAASALAAVHGKRPDLGHVRAERRQLGAADDLLATNRDGEPFGVHDELAERARQQIDRKSTRLNSSHTVISYAVFCLKKKTKKK